MQTLTLVGQLGCQSQLGEWCCFNTSADFSTLVYFADHGLSDRFPACRQLPPISRAVSLTQWDSEQWYIRSNNMGAQTGFAESIQGHYLGLPVAASAVNNFHFMLSSSLPITAPRNASLPCVSLACAYISFARVQPPASIVFQTIRPPRALKPPSSSCHLAASAGIFPTSTESLRSRVGLAAYLGVPALDGVSLSRQLATKKRQCRAARRNIAAVIKDSLVARGTCGSDINSENKCKPYFFTRIRFITDTIGFNYKTVPRFKNEACQTV